MKKKTERSILKIIKEKRTRCVGLAYSRGKYYFAVSGYDDNSEVNTIAIDIANMIGRNHLLYRCTILDTFSILKYFNYPKCSIYQPSMPNIYKPNNYKFIENFIYKALINNGSCTWKFPEKSSHVITFNRFRQEHIDFNKRFFSCVERKIVGFADSCLTIFVHYRPCYICLPTLSKVVYYDDYRKKCFAFEIKKQTKNTYTFLLKS